MCRSLHTGRAASGTQVPGAAKEPSQLPMNSLTDTNRHTKSMDTNGQPSKAEPSRARNTYFTDRSQCCDKGAQTPREFNQGPASCAPVPNKWSKASTPSRATLISFLRLCFSMARSVSCSPSGLSATLPLSDYGRVARHLSSIELQAKSWA